MRREIFQGQGRIRRCLHPHERTHRKSEDVHQEVATAMIVIVMGVVGAGKTTVGKLLASQLGWEFADADDFHSQSNVEKIRHGIALTDADREPWLDRLREAIVHWIAADKSVVLACSALKRAYRAKLCVEPQV